MSAGTAVFEQPGPTRGADARSRFGTLAAKPATPAVAALFVLAALLRFYHLGHQGFWFDEANTALLVHFSPGKMIGLIPQTESTPPLYYCVAWVWARVFGFGESGLRSLSAVAGVLVVPVVYGAGARLLSRRAGLIAAALCACNPFLIWYSQEARSYELLVLFCSLSLLAFAHLLEAPTRRAVAFWVLACALALATHYYAVVLVVPQAAWLLISHRRHRGVLAGLGLVTACGLALVPLALSQNSTGHDSWIAHTPLGLRLEQVIPQFLIGTDAPARVALKYASFALLIVALSALARRAPERASGRVRSGALLASDLALTGLLLSLAFTAAGSDALITRNIIGLWLPAALAVAGALALARPRILGLAVTLALCAIGVTAAVGVAVNYDFQRPDWRLVANVLGRSPGPGQARVILVQHYRTLLPLSLYLPGLRFLGRGGVTAREFDVVTVSSPQQPLCWWGAACNLIPSRLQQSYPLGGMRVVSRRRVRRFTVLRMEAVGGPVHITPAEVSRVLRTTSLFRDGLLLQR